ncbi:TraR/DksA family transcriptional regulator [Propionibacteriaceae bacterium ES.041]|uniref:TraR/DksA family transcriptional regulator n=1 Tax=Enemella evansiae TaxID=2016499 RepID=UPI000B963ADC|nr:TraR/DksA C4-type zinc finger protein [Enemella evansiae]OYN94669.1 DNA-binding protein [Enemella evansiae]OYO07059.1 DNA-binding protein [Enemella evansiae]PFG67742.1 TraR/DksA family transcriptional regulator [Propionibacteriaceae bacterium ES.041]
MEQERAKRLLVAAQREVLERAGALDDAFDDVVAALRDSNADDEHDTEGQTIAVDRAMADALRRGARDQLQRIDAALERLDEGTYGVCANCGRPIGDERLEALPTTTLCVDCARRAAG